MSSTSDLEAGPPDPLGRLAPASRRTPRWPIGLAALGVVGILAGVSQLEASPLDRVLLLNRGLARLSFLFFIPIHAATPLARWLPGSTTRGLLRVRRTLGLGYALVMAVHLGAIIAYQWTPGADAIDTATLVFGGFGFVLIAALAATSNDRSVRRLGARRWKRLHGFALHYLWMVYLVTYLGRIADGNPEYVPGLAAVFGLLAFRLSARSGRAA